jgi:hypothetical protein
VATYSENGGGAIKKSRPTGKLKRSSRTQAALPSQQEKIAAFISAFINQYKQGHAR